MAAAGKPSSVLPQTGDRARRAPGLSTSSMPFVEVRDVAGLLANSPVAVAVPGARCLGLELRGESAAGENFGSTFLKLTAHFEEPGSGEAGATRTFTAPVVGKRLPPTEYLRTVFNVDVSFPKEVNFYRNVVRAMEDLQRELDIAEDERIQVFPKLFGARLGASEDRVDDEAILLLEDITASGYSSAERQTGLDLAHCRVVVRDLARFHALGIALRRLRPTVFSTKVKEACIYFRHNLSKEDTQNVHLSFQRNTLNVLKKDAPQVLSVLGEERTRDAVLVGHEGLEPLDREPFTSIVHYDFWVNNMMLHHDAEGRPDRMKMVDFQLTEMGSPVRDLLFFLYTSADSAALREVDALLSEYHAELTRYLGLHGVGVQDMGPDAFDREVRHAARKELPHIFIMIMMIRADRAVEREDTHSDEVFSTQLGCSPAAATRYTEMLTHWKERGWL